jgi:hypothetical protein
MNSRFDYILDKITTAEVATFPFEHIKILDLFNNDDFKEIVKAPEILLKKSKDDAELFSNLFSNDYRVIKFPGCIVEHEEYIDWHKNKEKSSIINTSCEGFGIVLRLNKPQSIIINELNEFLNSDAFIETLAKKFKINSKDCTYDAGIQKYLDGYEISPHPDIRRKALTYMININPNKNSELESHHTSYLSFNKERCYVEDYWLKHKSVERCWVPWDWCQIKSSQPENNSVVIFSPGNDSMHAVKADYDHLNYQRTQLYGNLWYKNSPKVYQSKWEDYKDEGKLLTKEFVDKKVDLLTELKGKIPRSVRQKYSKLVKRGTGETHSDRKF